MRWRDKNRGRSPFDPDYLEGYDPEEDKQAYDDACEEREERRMDQ